MLGLRSSRSPMEEFVNSFFNRNLSVGFDYKPICDCVPRARIKETDDNYALSFTLPGFKKEDIDIKIENNNLVISSQVEEDEYKESFENSYIIPEDVDMEKIDASMGDGILTVTVGKYKLPKTNVKKIDIK